MNPKIDNNDLLQAYVDKRIRLIGRLQARITKLMREIEFFPCGHKRTPRNTGRRRRTQSQKYCMICRICDAQRVAQNLRDKLTTIN